MSSTESQRPDSLSRGPLSGVRIADLTTVVMGPMATRILGDLGADVIRVEAPDYDFMRDFEPKRSPGMSGFSLNINRNKRSLTLDLKSSEGHQALLDLVATCDVFVTNMRSDARERLSIGPGDLCAVKPDLIYCAANGFGEDGPYAGKAAYDDVIQAVSGLASMFAWTGPEPAYVPTIVADKVTGLHVVYAITAALYRKATTGEGDVIEVPMAETMAAFNLVEHLNGHTFEPKEEPFSYQRLLTKNRKPRRSKDGWICLLPYSDQNWRDFFAYVGHPEIAQDPRFATINDRVKNVDALYGELEPFTESRTTAEWMAFCDTHSIPAVPVVDLRHIDEDPHFAAVELLEPAEHPTEGAYRVVRDPVRFASGNAGVHRHAPRPGQQTVEVLRELGYDEGTISRLTDE